MGSVARDRDGLDRVVGESRRGEKTREDETGNEKSK
jgi:hypothetical protein